MRKLVVSEFVTLDGVAEEPGKWSFPLWNEEISKFKFDELEHFSRELFAEKIRSLTGDFCRGC